MNFTTRYCFQHVPKTIEFDLNTLGFVQTISYGLKCKIESFGIAILCHGRPCMRKNKAKKGCHWKACQAVEHIWVETFMIYHSISITIVPLMIRNMEIQNPLILHKN